MAASTGRVRRVRAAVCVLALVAALGAGAVPALAADAPPSTQKTTALAQRLLEKFFDMLSPPDIPALRKFLSSAYLVQRANGTFATKAETLANPSVLESYEIRNLEVTRTGPVIVARYDLVADVTIDGEAYATEPAPRLAVFTKGEQGWQITAYANFNVPASEADADAAPTT
jgi:hypothetical protein